MLHNATPNWKYIYSFYFQLLNTRLGHTITISNVFTFVLKWKVKTIPRSSEQSFFPIYPAILKVFLEMLVSGYCQRKIILVSIWDGQDTLTQL